MTIIARAREKESEVNNRIECNRCASSISYLSTSTDPRLHSQCLSFPLIHDNLGEYLCSSADTSAIARKDIPSPVSTVFSRKPSPLSFPLSLAYGVSVAIYQSALLNFGAANMADYGVTRLLHRAAATFVTRSRS